MPDKFFSGGFRSTPTPVAGTDRRSKGIDRSLGSSRPIPGTSTAEKITTQEAISNAVTPGSAQSARLSQTQEKVPLSKQNAQFAADFARDSKELATKRGLTGAQRRAQLGALTNAYKLRSAGIEENDPRAVAIRGLGEAANERGLSGLQRRLQSASASTLLDDTLGYEKDKPLTFDEQLDKELGI